MTRSARIPRFALVCLLAAGLAATGAPYAGTAEARAVASCDGHRATIVGTPGGTFHGTRHRDVIVTNGAGGNAGAGDDLICVNRWHAGTFVFAGAGDDRVDARRTHDTPRGKAVKVDLGTGDDSYRGGQGNDDVFTDYGRDTVRTGGGDDYVADGNGQVVGRARAHIDLGPGSDTAFVHGHPAGGRVDGGPGPDYVVPLNICESDPIVLDARAGVLRIAGREVLHLSGFASYDLGFSPRRLTFHGTPGRDHLALANFSLRCGSSRAKRVDVSMGGGNDSIDSEFVLRGRLDGGAGRDRFHGQLAAETSLDIDLSGPVVSDSVRTLTIKRLDVLDLGVTGTPATMTLTGTRRDDTVALTRIAPGPTLTVHARAGDDHITASPAATMYGGRGDDVLRAVSEDSTLYGGPGDDQLRGGFGDDVLVGDDGTDSADGRLGNDLCDAETVRSCEQITP